MLSIWADSQLSEGPNCCNSLYQLLQKSLILPHLLHIFTNNCCKFQNEVLQLLQGAPFPIKSHLNMLNKKLLEIYILDLIVASCDFELKLIVANCNSIICNCCELQLKCP